MDKEHSKPDSKTYNNGSAVYHSLKMEEKNANFHKTHLPLNTILTESLEPFEVIFSSKNIEINTALEKEAFVSGRRKTCQTVI